MRKVLAIAFNPFPVPENILFIGSTLSSGFEASSKEPLGPNTTSFSSSSTIFPG